MTTTRTIATKLVESPLLRNGHGGFGKRPGETCRWKDRQRAPGRLHGGKDHYAADREAAAEVIEAFPEVPTLARANRGFLQRAVRYLAGECGIRQFVDLGTGIPTQGPVHEVAQALAPDARVAYVDNDPVVLAHSRALLSHNAPGVATVNGDLRHPEEILNSPDLRALIDFEEPVAVLFVAVLHFATDADDPARIVTCFREVMAPGSYVALSHVSYGTHDHAAVDEAAAVYDRATSSITPRTRGQIQHLFDGFALVEPGLVDVSRWRPEAATAETGLQVLAGVGRLP